MAIKLVITLRGEVVGCMPSNNSVWYIAQAAEEVGFKVYKCFVEDMSVCVLGNYGWKQLFAPPAVVLLALMIDN